MVQPEIETQQTQDAPTIAELLEDIATKDDIAEVREYMITKEDLAKMEARLTWRLMVAMIGNAAVALAIACLLFG